MHSKRITQCGISNLRSYSFKLLLGFVIVALSSTLSSAQNRSTITGTVTDASDGSPLPAVNVVVKGTTVGTATSIDGTYSLSVPSDADSLQFSFLGYVTQTVAIDGRSMIDIMLQPSVEFLEDIVVVGYGAQDEKEITSSVATIGEADFNKGNVNNASELLQGKVPGLSIYNKGGDPNSTPTIRLRGISTVGDNTEPLVVIDGVIGASLDNVDPSDIASINVLKDGSAAAIYGSRGSSGVILVTTKKGEYAAGQNASENIEVTYNGYVSAATVQNRPNVMTADEYIQAGGNDLGSRTDWQDEVTRTGMSNVHNISVAGGTQSTIYRVSTNVREINGILQNSGFNQINARANISHRAFDNRLNVTLNLSATKRESSYSFAEALRYAVLYNPTAPIYFDNGDYYQAILFDNFNPVAIVEQNINDGTSKNMNFNIQGDFSITDQWSVNANFGQQFNSFLNGEFYPSTSFFRGLNENGLAARSTGEDKFTLFETYTTYRTDFGDFDITGTAGYSFQEEENEGFNLTMGNLPTDLLGYHGIRNSGDINVGGTANVRVGSYASPQERIIAYFGRVNLNWKDAVFFNASLRQEGSTKLGEDNKWGLFPALGLGTDVTSFIGNDLFTQLKVRLGYGVTGALPSSSGLSKTIYGYSFSGTGSFDAVSEANPDLKWEEKAETNLGIDFGLMDDKLTGSVDVYTRNITDFILSVAIPATESVSGATSQYQNVGELKTNGLEISLNYLALQNEDMQWNTGLTFSTYKTTLEKFIAAEQMRANLGSPGQNSTSMIRVAEGEEIGQIWGPVFESVDTDGSPIMKDINGDGQLIVGQGDALADDGDFTQLGNGIPDFELGWTNTFNYQNWSLDAFFRGAFGHSLVNTFRAFYEPIDPGAINSYNRVKSDKSVDGLTVAQFSSLYVEKADFVKLDNVTLSYTFDVNENNPFKNIRVYGNIQNAFTLTNYSGIDPEPVFQDYGPIDNGGRPAATPDVLSPGIDRRYNYFTARTFTFGINLEF
ncbi:MAG TPA: SusC/RagA family TonB-linked outer membrane protein [Balneolaceae bacterium]|nr:SusC/RagA family TonB-linked outer membrane protein [Balneolaceae bacterium]|tara:strand:- start:3292 stop:6306 length:3015 start_codon:yes stop_codon:yes gene_type:complete